MSILIDKNRRLQQSTRDGNKDLRTWFVNAFTKALNLRTEQTCADPDYATLTRTGVTGADASPASTPPTDNIWDLKGYWGLHGYTVQTGSGSVDLELWAWDGTAEKWFLVETKSTVADQAEFHFDGKVRNRIVFVRIAALNTITSINLSASPE